METPAEPSSQPGRLNPYHDLLAGIDPDAFDLPEDDLIFSPTELKVWSADPSPPPTSLGTASLLAAGVDDDDELLPSSQPNERASNWLMAPPAPSRPPPPPVPPAGQTTMTVPAGGNPAGPASTSLSDATSLGRGAAPARSVSGGREGQAADDAAAADAASAKRRKVSHDSWTAGSSPELSAGGRSEAMEPRRDFDDEYGFVQPDRKSACSQAPCQSRGCLQLPKTASWCSCPPGFAQAFVSTLTSDATLQCRSGRPRRLQKLPS
jgi:hypothetical protein